MGERDMVAMFHQFGVTFPNSERADEIRTSELLGYGTPEGDTIMGKTVGITIAVGAELLLSGAGKGGGVLLPITPDIYEPGLQMLEQEGLVFKEHARVL